MVNLNFDTGLEGSPQSRIVDPHDVPFENSCAPRIIERGDRRADFAARAAKEAGVKALVIYPINALASDQARRIAELVASTSAFAGLRVSDEVEREGLDLALHGETVH